MVWELLIFKWRWLISLIKIVKYNGKLIIAKISDIGYGGYELVHLSYLRFIH